MIYKDTDIVLAMSDLAQATLSMAEALQTMAEIQGLLIGIVVLNMIMTIWLYKKGCNERD